MPLQLSRRRFIVSSAAVAGIFGAAKIARAAPAPIRITRHRIPWSGEKKLRILHLTDIHVGWSTPPPVLAHVVDMAWTLEPDMVVLTGDYVNRSLAHAERLSAFVASLPRPVIATLGNHDHWASAEGVTQALQKGGATVLSNQAELIDGLGWSLEVIGLDDGFSKHADILGALAQAKNPDKSLVLTHYPPTFDALAEKGARLVVAGHTHGGQISFPVVTPAFHRLIGNPYLAGWFEQGESSLYVSAGIGHSLEGLRGGESATAEVAVYELDPTAKVRETKTYRGA